MRAGRRWFATVAVLTALAACSGGDDGGDQVTADEDGAIDLDLSGDGLREGVVDVGAVDGCVLDDGVTVTRTQLDTGGCTLAGRPRSIRAAKHPQACADGSELWVAGRDGEDAGGGWTNLGAEGEGTWTTGPYADAAASCG